MRTVVLRHFVAHLTLGHPVPWGTRREQALQEATSILVVGDGTEASRLRQRLARHFLTVEGARTIGESREVIKRCRFHVLLLVDPTEPWRALRKALRDCEGLPSDILLIGERSCAEIAVEALRDGVADVLLRPFTTQDLVAAVVALSAQGASRHPHRIGKYEQHLVGNAAPIRELRAVIGRIAPAATAVLVEGEAGTGRTLVARLLHEQAGGPGPFRVFDCGVAGAERLARDLRETDGGGTLCLREVHRLPLDLQAELLRSIRPAQVTTADESLVMRRIVASTQVALGELTARRRFSRDLYHRLGVLRTGLPPLRERREDIPLLFAHFIDKLSVQAGLPRVELQPAEIESLAQYDWPGNVAELRHTAEQTLLRGQLPADAFRGSVERSADTRDYPLDWTLEQVKRHHMACVLEACDGNKSAAARRLDVSRKTLDRKLGASGRG